MKAVIFAGGLGTRLAEETQNIPKPMVTIGHQPMLWHIMKIYRHHGIRDFVVCLGYKGYIIKEYFANYVRHNSDFTIDMTGNELKMHRAPGEDWRVTLIETGENTMTGGRLKRVAEYLKDEEAFCLTYGDAVADVNVADTIKFHKQHGKLATVTAVHPIARFGALEMQGDKVTRFEEKPLDQSFINGGFFVLSPKVIPFIKGDETMWEHEPMQKLAEQGELMAYRHTGFWHCMDTLKNKQDLEKIWASGDAPWQVWSDAAPTKTPKLKVVTA